VYRLTAAEINTNAIIAHFDMRFDRIEQLLAEHGDCRMCSPTVYPAPDGTSEL